MSDDLVERLRVSNNPNNYGPVSLMCQYLIDRRQAADEITSLRERLEQAERERDEYRMTVEQGMHYLSPSYRDGFRAGIEAAGNKDFLRPIVEDQAAGEWDDIMIDEDVRKFSSAIRALAPTDNTTPYCWACHYAGDCGCKSSDNATTVADPTNRVESICRELRNSGYMVPVSVMDRALAAQTGGE